MRFLNYYDETNPENTFQETVAPEMQPMGQMPQLGNNPVPTPLPGNNNYNGIPFDQRNTSNMQPYKKGGRVKKRSLPQLAEVIRAKGRNGDTILAHINPQEAMLLKQHGGSGTINPKTGLPEFGLFNNPGKWLKGSLGGVGGAILGNMLLPGIGGIIGGAIGGAAGSKVRGRKDYQQSGIRGASMGAILPSAASLASSATTSMGAKEAGKYLADYGTKNAILPSLGFKAAKEVGTSAAANTASNAASSSLSAAEKEAFIKSLTPEKSLLSKTGDFLMKPETMLSVGTLGLSAYNSMKKPEKEKSPEQLANEKKRYQNAMKLSPEEIEENNRYLKLLEGRSTMGPNLPERKMYRKRSSPTEIAATGKHFLYYDNPEFKGAPEYKKGGNVGAEIEVLENYTPRSVYFKGASGGQDDNIKTRLPSGGYVLDAYTISNLGDGNSDAGANKVDQMLETVPAKVSNGEYYIAPKDVKALGGADVLDKMRKNLKKHKGVGKVKLPPKAKKITDYMR